MVAKKKVVKKIKTLPKTKPKIVKKIEAKKKIPLGIKIISTYYIIVASLTIIIGLIAIIFSKTLSTVTIDFGQNFPKEIVNDPNLFLIIGFAFLIVGIVNLILGINLWKLKKWARIVIVIFAIISFIYAFKGLMLGQLSNLFGLIIEGIIAGYLIFSKKANNAFK